MPEPILHQAYSRKEVHDIFSPGTSFTQSSGSWGLHGIVEIPDHPGDFVFFVTFGQQQAGHIFEEWITEEGVFSWQSQPRQSFEDRRIQQFIHHDESKNSIYLFLRTQRSANYTYLGTLKYLAHDPQRARPVYMVWQLLDWPIPANVLGRIDLRLQPANIYRPGTFQAMQPAARYDHQAASFVWRAKSWQVEPQALISQVKDWIARGLPEEAIRYANWYIEIDGQRISPKWLFHLITGADYSEFNAHQARDKLARIGFHTVAVRARDIHTDIDRVGEDEQMVGVHLKPEERFLFFKTIAQLLEKEFPETIVDAEFRFYERSNWFEIHFPGLRGYYSLRKARQFDEFAYFFSGSSEQAYLLTQRVTPHLASISEQVGYSVSATPNYWKQLGRLGFEVSNDPYASAFYRLGFVARRLESGLDLDGEITFITTVDEFPIPLQPKITACLNKYRYTYRSLEIPYAAIMASFIQATYALLRGFHGYSDNVRLSTKSGPGESLDLQYGLLEAKISEIRHTLSGAASMPPDEVICDWVHFYYDFGLYEEGHMLFALVTSEQVNPWYYQRAKKLARLCSMKASTKD